VQLVWTSYLTADHHEGACYIFGRTGADKQKGVLPRGLVALQKYDYFCDGYVFFIDRGLLMGALISNDASL
jgi:hypothetical protein